jgi:deoxyhypusine synthase
MTVGELVDELGKAGAYNGGSLWQAVNIYERLLRDEKTLKYLRPLGRHGARGDGRDRCRTHPAGAHRRPRLDGRKPHPRRHRGGWLPPLPRTAQVSDTELCEEGVNRIYDIFLPNEAFIRFEEFMQDVYSSLPEGSTISISASSTG